MFWCKKYLLSQENRTIFVQFLEVFQLVLMLRLLLGWRCGSPSRVPQEWDGSLMKKSTQKKLRQFSTGWWLGHPSEKYESQLGWLFPIYVKKMFQTTNQSRYEILTAKTREKTLKIPKGAWRDENWAASFLCRDVIGNHKEVSWNGGTVPPNHPCIDGMFPHRSSISGMTIYGTPDIFYLIQCLDTLKSNLEPLGVGW